MSNPFLLQPDKAPKDSTQVEDTGTEYTSPLETYDPQHNSLEELASQDTSHIAALRTRADNIVNRTEKYVLKEAEDVKAMCETLDAAMQDESTIDFFELPKIRGYVHTLMVTLKQKPEYSGILLDSDVANVVRFARLCYVQAIEDNNAKLDKRAANKAKRAAKAVTPTAIKKKKQASALDDIDFGDLF